MIYGANGFTGALLARRAADAGERPILAGRDARAVGALAQRLGLAHRIVDLADPVGLRAALTDVEAVAHCAGPFSATALPMVHACLDTRTHYVDVTGEIDVFEALYALHNPAAAAGVAIVPGVGFDVVPTEYLATRLAYDLPSATHLDIALIGRGGFSAGTLRTGLEGIRRGGQVRSDGLIAAVPLAHRRRHIRTSAGVRTVHSLPLGDVSAVYRATGIPNITDFAIVPYGTLVRFADPLLRGVLAVPGLSTLLGHAIDALISGPSDLERADSRGELWAEARDEAGHTARMRLSVAGTYDFTTASTLHAVRNLLGTNSIPGGAWTPGQAFGGDFLLDIPGSGVLVSSATVPALAGPAHHSKGFR